MSRSPDPHLVITDRRRSFAYAASDLRRRLLVATLTMTTGVGAILGSGTATIAAALAQGAPAAAILIDGNAVVTGFSGVRPMSGAPAQAPADPADALTIDLAGPAARVLDLQAPGAPAQAQLLDVTKPFTVTAGEIGQVFAVTLDNATPPNIYLGATSAYGLPIVVPGADGAPMRSRQGAVGARFMPGLFGPAERGGGPGSIWRVDGKTGTVRLFANVALDGVPNSGPALGGLAFDTMSGSIFAADRQTGMIHRFDLSGVERGRFDHGTQGRTAAGLMAVAYDGANRLDIAQASFRSDDPSTFGYAPVARLVSGLAVHSGRLYYAVADGLQVWSVALNPDGAFAGDARIELQVPPWDGESEISKIAFDDQGRMLLAERAAATGAYDFEALAKAGVGRVLRYRPVPPRLSSTAAPQSASASAGLWQPEPDEYAIGFAVRLRNGNGGLAVGYDYTPDGRIDRRTCGGFLWSSGEQLRATTDPALAARLDARGPANVDGLQGNALSLVRPANVPPLKTYFVDYDDRFDDAAARGHLGDVAIWRVCGHAEPALDMPVDDVGGFEEGGEIWLPVCVRDDLRHDVRDGGRNEFRRHRRCCPREFFHEGRCWRFPPPCPRDEIKLRNGECCPRQDVRDGECHKIPPRDCPPHEIKLPNGQCCLPTNVREGRCVPPPPTTCPPGTTLRDGKCVPVRRIDVNPPRRPVFIPRPILPKPHIVIDVPPRHGTGGPIGRKPSGINPIPHGGGRGLTLPFTGPRLGGFGGGGRMAFGGMGFGRR